MSSTTKLPGTDVPAAPAAAAWSRSSPLPSLFPSPSPSLPRSCTRHAARGAEEERASSFRWPLRFTRSRSACGASPIACMMYCRMRGASRALVVAVTGV
ncbi:hypothetical protein FGB62_114g111 [Gracilaria domingensis]|nr:hypothetical protein FGB62_114g111 [Gracilaria domingensis]